MILLDTNVVSELMRPQPAPAAVDGSGAQAASNLYLTMRSEAALRYGVANLPSGQRRIQLEQAVESMREENFAERIRPFDRAAAQAYAVVATRNVEDFTYCGIEMVNPWTV